MVDSIFFKVAIDGYSACGKSSIAKELSKRLDLLYVDSGAMYRAFAYHMLMKRGAISEEWVEELMDSFDLQFVADQGINTVIVDGVDISQDIREERISQGASQVAQYGAVRRGLVKRQQEFGLANHVIMEGRDIGTVVFPNAQVKIFLRATIDARTERRYTELIGKGIRANKDEVRTNLIKRDQRDSSRKESPLAQAEDAISIDNTNLSLKETIIMIEALIRHRINS